MTAKNYLYNTMLPALFYGAITGLISGAVIWGYSFIAEELVSVSRSMYEFFRNDLRFLPLLLVVLLAGATIGFFNGKFAPEVRGGGVPYIEGAARGMLPLKWYRAVPAAMVGSFVSFVCGLPLGSEGPSVLIGGALGGGVNFVGGKYDKRRGAWSRITVTSGASAGFATALNAPLAGILFALEECHKKFSPVVLLTSAVSVVFAMVASGLLRLVTGMGEHALFDFAVAGLPVTDLYLPLIAGVIVGLAATGFYFLLRLSRKVVARIRIPEIVKMMAAFLLCGVVCLLLTDFIGGGAALIRKVGAMQIGWKLILLLLVLKLLLITLCSSSRITGGMFIPLLCLGALTGGLIARVMMACGMNDAYYSTIVVISMCAFLGASLKAPITAVVLIVELVGGVSSLVPSLVGIVAAFLIAELFHTKPLYDDMLEDVIERRRAGKQPSFVKFELTVGEGSYAVGKFLRDILLPSEVTAIVHKDASGGDNTPEIGRGTEIKSGDTMIIEAGTTDEARLKKELSAIFGSA